METTTDIHAVEQYAGDVLANVIPTCKWIKLAARRFIDDLEHGEERGIWFDFDEADRAIEFFGLLNLWEGEWAGRPWKLEPWQKFLVGNLFGWRQREDGLRRFRTCYLSIARKNAKSTIAAGIGLYMLDMDGEPGAQVYSAATKREQAKIIFECAKNLVATSPNLTGRIEPLTNNMHVLDTRSKFEPLAAEAKTADGLSIHCALVDELHAHPNRKLLDVLATATGSRRQPLIASVTTAGYDKHTICYEQHDYSQKILEGILKDDTFFPLIYCLDDDDDWRDETNWYKANPNLGVSVKLDDLQRKAKQAAEMPAAQNSFRRLHCNEWTEQSERWLDMAVWDRNVNEFAPELLAGRTCFGGLDLAKTSDLSAFALVFPPEAEDEKWKILIRFWIPEENIQKRVDKDRVPYDVWHKQGFIQTTEGDVADYRVIREDILNICQDYQVKEIAFDRMFANEITQYLTDEGLVMVPFGQGFYSMPAPTFELEKLLLGEQVAHNGHPVLRWNASNVAVAQDPAGNIKPDKAKSTEKIDGIVAVIMALGRAIVREKDVVSVYATRGALIV